MASIFEELMNANSNLTESVRPARRAGKKVSEHKKIPVKNLKVESLRIFEEADYEEVGQEFANTEVTEENPDEVVLVIDPALPADEEVPEDAAENMIGKSVYKCPICGSNYVCDCNEELGEGIETDENGVPTECPICGDDSDQILIGEIAPAEGAGEEVDPDLEGNEEVEDEDDEFAEEDEVFEEDPLEDEEVPSEEDEVVEEESLTELFGKNKKSQKGDKTFKIIHSQNNETVKGGLKSKDDALAWIEDNVDPEESSKYLIRTESLNEDLEDDGLDETAVEVPEEDAAAPALELDIPEEEEPADEPCPDVEIHDSTVTLLLDDAKFESLMTKMIRENYKGSPAFKITRCSSRKSQLRLEYFVREGSKVTKGIMIGEGFDKTSRVMSLKFKDKGAFTESFAQEPSFIVECVRLRNTVAPVSVSYDYKVRVNESMYRVNGKVGK